MQTCPNINVYICIIYRYKRFFKPFKVPTGVLSTDKYPTYIQGCTAFNKHCLACQLSKQKPDESETLAVTEIMTMIITDLDERYSEGKGTFMLLYEVNYLLSMLPSACFILKEE